MSNSVEQGTTEESKPYCMLCIDTLTGLICRVVFYRYRKDGEIETLAMVDGTNVDGNIRKDGDGSAGAETTAYQDADTPACEGGDADNPTSP